MARRRDHVDITIDSSICTRCSSACVGEIAVILRDIGRRQVMDTETVHNLHLLSSFQDALSTLMSELASPNSSLLQPVSTNRL